MASVEIVRGLIAAVGLVTFGAAQAAEIAGLGATFPYAIYSKWADAYKGKTGIGMIVTTELPPFAYLSPCGLPLQIASQCCKKRRD